MKRANVFVLVAALAALAPQSASALLLQQPPGASEDGDGLRLASAEVPDLAPDIAFFLHVSERADADLAALMSLRPAYSFWQHIFLIPDGAVAYGSRQDGRLLATFPTRGDWSRGARLEETVLAAVLQGQRLTNALTQRREQVAEIFEGAVGPVVHNATRGNFLLPNARRYGGFLGEWAAIYERFGVPAEIGLAQAIVESGLNGRVRSEAGALGFCQWLARNWDRMNRLSPHVLEVQNQTTQAPYCAAYLTVLATKYGTFIPALSEHHAGGVNVGRVVITGERLGAQTVRDQYLLGAEFARDLRAIAPRTFSDIYRTYGPRSFLYAEMVFGNTFTVRNILASTAQETIYAMRAPRPIPLTEVTQRTGLSADQVRRFNPALVRQVPAGANLYLPTYVAAFGPDVSFWHRPPSVEFATVLNDFLRLETNPTEWEHPSFEPVLRGFQRRFRETGTEEGIVMATVISYVMQEAALSRRILEEYRTSPRIMTLFERGVRERETWLSNGRGF